MLTGTEGSPRELLSQEMGALGLKEKRIRGKG